MQSTLEHEQPEGECRHLVLWMIRDICRPGAWASPPRVQVLRTELVRRLSLAVAAEPGLRLYLEHNANNLTALELLNESTATGDGVDRDIRLQKRDRRGGSRQSGKRS